MHDYPLVLSEQTINEFDQRGFVLTSGVLSSDEVDRYGVAVDAEVARRTQGDQRTMVQKSRYEQSFIQCMRLWETEPVVRELSCDSRLAGMAAQLLGESGVLMWQDQALYKEAGGQATTPHQDQTFWPVGDSPIISAWIALDDVSVRGGAMAYVPGSHKAGALRVVDITHRTEPYDILTDPALQGAQPEFVEVSAGDVIWHHGYTVHQAAANQTNQTRRVFTVVYISDAGRRAKSFPCFPLDRAGVGQGDLIQGEGLPRLWPPQSTLPEPGLDIGGATGPQHH